MTVHDQVLAEMKRFEESLDSLMGEYRDKWVVFKDGKVLDAHDTEEEAYKAGIEFLGRDGGHVVAQVTPMITVPITAGVLYGLAC